MEPSDEIRQAITRLKAAGLEAQFVDTSKNNHPLRIQGWLNIPYPSQKPTITTPENYFYIFQEDGYWTARFRAFATSWPYVKISDKLDEVITAVCHYFEMKAARTDPPHYRIEQALCWLQKVGLQTEITSGKDLTAKSDSYNFNIHLEKNGWALTIHSDEGEAETILFDRLGSAVETIIEQHQTTNLIHERKL